MRGFAHVEFETADGVSNALRKAGEKLGGRELRIDRSGSKGGSGGGFRGGRGNDRGGRGGRGGNFGRGGRSDFRNESSGTGRFSSGAGNAKDIEL